MKERYSVAEKLWLKKAGFVADIASKIIPNPKEEEITSFYNIQYTSLSKLNTLDVHIPRGKKSFPCVFYVHGGAWCSADKNAYNFFVKEVCQQGYVVVNINYRLVPKVTIDECFVDVATAINFALTHKEQYQIDPYACFTIGDSAGCHLTGLFLKRLFENQIETVAPANFIGAAFYYGVFDFTAFNRSKTTLLPFFYNHYKRTYGKNYKEKLQEISVKNLPYNFPRIFVTAGEVDVFYKETRDFLQNLENNGNEYVALIFPKSRKDAKHVFLNFKKRNCSKQAFSTLINFMDDCYCNYKEEIKKNKTKRL